MKIKAILTALFALVLMQASAQDVTVTSNGSLIKDGHNEEGETKVSSRDGGWIVAWGKGMVSRAEKAETIVKNAANKRYVLNLKQQEKPAHHKDQKKIVFASFLDKTDKKDRLTYVVRSGITMAAPAVAAFADLDATTNSMNALLLEQGFAAYNEEESNTLGRVTAFEPELAIAGEVISYVVLTRGTPGFKTTMVVRWVVYDVAEKKPLYRSITGGYSNTGRATSEDEVFRLAGANALWGLMTDPGFLDLVNGGSAQEMAGASISLPYVPLVKQADYSSMIEEAVKSSVTIKTAGGHGSGFVISENGYVLTNYHVVEDSGKYEVLFNSGLKLTATLVASNRGRDVALLKINGEGFTPLPLDTSAAAPRVGTDVVAIGTPQDLKLKQTVTKGIVSGMRELHDQNFIQTDVSINSGNSGGALLNKDGAVIGIVVAKMKGNSVEGLGFAIPIKEALSALKIGFQ